MEPTSPPLRLLSVIEAAEALGISKAQCTRLIGAGELRSVKIGKRRLIPSDAIVEFITSLPAA